MLAERETSEVV